MEWSVAAATQVFYTKDVGFYSKCDKFGTKYDRFGTKYDKFCTKYDKFGTEYDIFDTNKWWDLYAELNILGTVQAILYLKW